MITIFISLYQYYLISLFFASSDWIQLVIRCGVHMVLGILIMHVYVRQVLRFGSRRRNGRINRSLSLTSKAKTKNNTESQIQSTSVLDTSKVKELPMEVSESKNETTSLNLDVNHAHLLLIYPLS